jgi:hypothetical protein
MSSKVFDETMEQIPGPCADSDVIMMYKAYKILQNLWDNMSMGFKVGAIPNANLHVL